MDKLANRAADSYRPEAIDHFSLKRTIGCATGMLPAFSDSAIGEACPAPFVIGDVRMCDILVWSFDGIRWPETISALAAVAMAAIAFFALQTWRHQDKAKGKAEFLDALIEAAHTYIAEVSKPITIFEMAKIGMTCHAPTWENGEQADIEIKGAVAYIQKNGEHDGKRLLEVLEAVQPSVIKLRSIAAKGQVFKFDDYAKCQNAVAMLTWHFDRIEAFVAVISSPTWNWDSPVVLKHLKDVMAINPDDIRKNVRENNIALLEFASEAYKRIYG